MLGIPWTKTFGNIEVLEKMKEKGYVYLTSDETSKPSNEHRKLGLFDTHRIYSRQERQRKAMNKL